MKISIVFPIFNGLAYTKACLASLFNDNEIDKKKAEINIVIIDDGSKDGSSEWIAQNYPNVLLLEGDGDLWWGGGINKGIDYALDVLHSDYILWWNNDIIAENDYFNNLIDIINSMDQNTIVGSKIFVSQQRDIVWALGGFFDPYSGKKGMVHAGQPDADNMQDPIEVDWLPGMGTLIHKSVFKNIGLVDNATFPQYHGDSDFVFRAKENGYKIMAYPALRLYNDTTNSGLRHHESLKLLFRSLGSIRSNYNIKKELKFYRRYAKSNRAYYTLFKRYFKYIGGFFKWKFLNAFGVKR